MPWNQISVLWSREVEGLSPGWCQDSSSITYSFSPTLQTFLTANVRDCNIQPTCWDSVASSSTAEQMLPCTFKWMWRSVIRNKLLSSHITQLETGLLVQLCSDAAPHPSWGSFYLGQMEPTVARNRSARIRGEICPWIFKSTISPHELLLCARSCCLPLTLALCAE